MTVSVSLAQDFISPARHKLLYDLSHPVSFVRCHRIALCTYFHLKVGWRLWRHIKLFPTNTNLIKTDVLDISFILNTGKYFPFKKPNNTPLYIHSKSNHPLPIMKQLPSMTNKRISNLFCDETEFNKAKITYETALKNNGY